MLLLIKTVLAGINNGVFSAAKDPDHLVVGDDAGRADEQAVSPHGSAKRAGRGRSSNTHRAPLPRSGHLCAPSLYSSTGGYFNYQYRTVLYIQTLYIYITVYLQYIIYVVYVVYRYRLQLNILKI